MRYVIVFLVLLFATGFQDSECGHVEIGKYGVFVDSRMELLSVIQLIGGYFEKYPQTTNHLDLDYRQEMFEYFSPYAKHAAVILYNELSNSGFTMDAPPTLMLHLSDPPDLTIEKPLTEYLAGRAHGQDRLENFIIALRDFVETTRFEKFIESHLQDYNKMVDEVPIVTNKIDLVSELESYYGTSKGRYSIILTPLFHLGGYGLNLERSDDTIDMYFIGGARDSDSGFVILFGMSSDILSSTLPLANL